MKKAVLLVGLLSHVASSISSDHEAYKELYTEFQSSLKNICKEQGQDRLARQWRTTAYDNICHEWKIVLLNQAGVYLLGEHVSNACIRRPIHYYEPYCKREGVGWIVTLFSKDKTAFDNFSMPSYEQCKQLLNLSDPISMHPAKFGFIFDENPYMESRMGPFFWKAHNTWPPYTVSLFDPENYNPDKIKLTFPTLTLKFPAPERVPHTLYDLSDSLTMMQLGKTCFALYAYRLDILYEKDETLDKLQLAKKILSPDGHSQPPKKNHLVLDLIKTKIMNNIPESAKKGIRLLSHPSGCFLMLTPTKTIANPEAFYNHQKVDGYYVTAYAKTADAIILPWKGVESYLSAMPYTKIPILLLYIYTVGKVIGFIKNLMMHTKDLMQKKSYTGNYILEINESRFY